MSSEERVNVEVLYDYSYSDDQGVVEIREGDTYILLDKTNSEWWHVYSENEDDGFYVPAQYVRILEKKQQKDQEVDKVISNLDDILGKEEDEPIYGNTSEGQSALHVGQSQTKGASPVSPTAPVVNGMGKTGQDSGGDYMNLDQYRATASIPSLDNQVHSSSNDVKESDYANLPFQLQQQQQQQQQQQSHGHSQEQWPRLEEGQFVRLLVPDLPWDMYEDRSGRKFYHNHDTGELSWKPPRKDKPSSPVAVGPPSTPAPTPAPKPQVVLQSPVSTESLTDDEYTKEHQGGEVFFVHNSTSEKWQQLADQSGRQYYHRLGSSDTQWALPSTSPRSLSEGQDSGARSGESEVGSLTNISIRPMSMYGKIERPQSSIPDPKASTLPPNFSPNSQLEKSPSLPTLQSQQTPARRHRFEDQLSGYLNKTKLTEVGKKKIKKNWEKVYLVLHGSNLIFYKDQKSAAHTPSSPHGKPESVISMQGAKVDFNPPKDITSRRNTIIVSVSSGLQFLLHCDDEKVILEWLLRLKMVADDLKEDQASKDSGSYGRTGLRTISESGVESVSAERARMAGIKNKLLSFLIRRPTQEDLIKQGIIKDAVFGSSLQAQCERDKAPVPNFVLECITAVEKKGLDQDGLYRVSGNLAEIQRLRFLVDKDDDHNLLDDQWDIHTLTGALKLFFRELKEPLFPGKCMDKFINASKKEFRKEKMKAFKEAISSLPKCNYETLRVLMQHLTNVVQHSSQNRMETHNVAIVFGPTLMWMSEGDFNNMAVLSVYQSKVVEFLLLEHDALFR